RHRPGQAPGDSRRLHLRRRLPRCAPAAGAARSADRDLRVQRRDRRGRAGGREVGGHERALRPVDRRLRGQPVLAPVMAGADHGQAGHRGDRAACRADADRRPAPGCGRPAQPGLRAAAGGAWLHRPGAATRAGARPGSDGRRMNTMTGDFAPAGASDTWMLREAAQAADVVEAQFAANRDLLGALAADLRRRPPAFAATCALASSGPAATHAKPLIETTLGLATASVSPSVGSVYGVRQRLGDALFVAISQSGRSPDLLRNAEAAREAGARVVALVNVADSPLAALADVVVPLLAGPEHSVAAT